MNTTDKISKYLTIGDAIKSETAVRYNIDNSLPDSLLGNAKYIATKVFDPIKEKFPNAGCYSFYRSYDVNVKVGGSKGSFHSFAAAIDIDTLGDVNNRDIFKWVIDGNIPFNQVIWEYGTLKQPKWVHVGIIEGDKRHDIKRIYFDSSGVVQNKTMSKEDAYKLFAL